MKSIRTATAVCLDSEISISVRIVSNYFVTGAKYAMLDLRTVFSLVGLIYVCKDKVRNQKNRFNAEISLVADFIILYYYIYYTYYVLAGVPGVARGN